MDACYLNADNCVSYYSSGIISGLVASVCLLPSQGFLNSSHRAGWQGTEDSHQNSNEFSVFGKQLFIKITLQFYG